MSQHPSPRLSAASVARAASVAILLTPGPVAAQNEKPVPASPPPPALPVDLATLTKEPAPPAATPSRTTVPKAKEANSEEAVTDYSTRIGTGLKERERRLMLLNEAMMKLREAGENEDAAHVELRIRALLEMPVPSQEDSKRQAEIEQLKNKNDELALQIVNLQEELKRTKSPPTGSRRGVAANSER